MQTVSFKHRGTAKPFGLHRFPLLSPRQELSLDKRSVLRISMFTIAIAKKVGIVISKRERNAAMLKHEELKKNSCYSVECVRKAMKPVIFVGTSLDDVKAFPPDARRAAGFQIHSVQAGREPDDWKPVKAVGAGVIEIRIHEDGEFRVILVAKFQEAVYVLHAFQKKSQKILKKDILIARNRYATVLRER